MTQNSFYVEEMNVAERWAESTVACNAVARKMFLAGKEVSVAEMYNRMWRSQLETLMKIWLCFARSALLSDVGKL